MSNHEGASRRRRIAGESKPSDARVPTPAKKVVKKPVSRPGIPAEPRPDVEPVEVTPVESDAPATDVPETDSAADLAQPEAEQASAPKVAPRVGRRRPAAEQAVASTSVDETPDADTDADDEPAASSDDEAGSGTTGRRRPPIGRVLLVAVTVAAIAFGAVFAFRGVTEWRQTHGVDGAHAQAAESAATAAETIFSYRYDRLEQYLEDSKDVMTASFAKDFETISPALNDLAPQRQIQVEATTRDSAPLGCGDDCRRDQATVLLFVDQARLADGSEVPTVFGNRVELTMVERDGRWLVDDIKAL